jgi:hypothetical protein
MNRLYAPSPSSGNAHLLTEKFSLILIAAIVSGRDTTLNVANANARPGPGERRQHNPRK